MLTRRIGLVAAGAVAAAATCAGPAAEDLGQPEPGPAHTRELLTAPPAAAGEPPRDLLIRDAEHTYPTTSYAGVTVDGTALVIHRVPVPGVGRLDTRLRVRHPELRLVFADARHPRTVLDQVSSSIVADIPYWRARGVAVGAVAARADGSGVRLVVGQVGVGLADAMRERYEFPDLTLVHGEIVPA
ncbi:hypothetical protein [Micromonospora sp. WMMD1082]|uniref:hypothetical protein n=1 Tax=Micromonospora sp. WMMD1082 TaxID=3016104 RepID=UPI002417AA5B|nr:hypothetical protein [Micromonospora sp. WMMD1082]MDG4798273.1 hypothetical protein [Micromonospora sp. WMMD1082]